MNRSSHPEVFLEKDALKICSKFTGEHSCWSVISIKLQSNFIEIALQHGCSPVSLLHIFRKTSPKNTSRCLLLDEMDYHLKWSAQNCSSNELKLKSVHILVHSVLLWSLVDSFLFSFSLVILFLSSNFHKKYNETVLFLKIFLWRCCKSHLIFLLHCLVFIICLAIPCSNLYQ